MYKVRTKNWHSSFIVWKLLDLTRKIGVKKDYDKYYLDTRSPCLAWFVWFYFMILKKWSGGSTYIILPGHSSTDKFKCIY